MRQKLFAGWAIALMMFMLYSCSSEINDYLDNKEIESLQSDKDGVATRWVDPWEEEEESPLEWATSEEGTGLYSPSEPREFYIGENPKFKTDDEYNYYACFSWYAGFPDESERQVAYLYYMQIQWSYTEYPPKWHYISMPDNEHGLVNILNSTTLEDIPAYAFPYGVGKKPLYLRMRTIHKDFITLVPDPEVESQYKYDRNLFSNWNYPSNIGNYYYYNYWGFGKPQPELVENNWVEDDTDETNGSLIVRVYLPYEIGNQKQYSYSYEITNLTGGYSERLNGSTNALGIGKSSVAVIGKRGGSVEVFATRRDNSTNGCSYSSQWVDYDTGEREIEVHFGKHNFGY